MTPKQASQCSTSLDKLLDPVLFKSLCDPTRLKLLACLMKCGRASTVTELAECCSVDFSVVSRHLAILQRAGVLQAVKQGRAVMYAVQYRQLSQRLRVLADAIEACCPPNSRKPTEIGYGKR